MKKLSKIFALVLAVLCIGVGLAACGPESGTFNYATCRSKYVDAGYKVTNMSVAINNTKEYLDLAEKTTLTPTETTRMTELEELGFYDKGGSLLINSTAKTEGLAIYNSKEKYSYRTAGFIATKRDATAATDTVIIIQYKSTASPITGFANRLDDKQLYYSNAKVETVKAVYDWGTAK